MAIALLKTLSASGGRLRTTDLTASLDIPRSSLHRINRTLAREGLLELARGTVSVGPTADRFVDRRRHQVDRSYQQRISARGNRQSSRPATPPANRLEDGPVQLSAPHVIHGNRALRIGFSNASLSNPWRIALVHSIEYGAARLGKAVERLSVRHADDNSAQQCQHIEDLLHEGVDGLLVSGAGTPQVDACIRSAVEQGVTVVFVDRGPSAADIGARSFVTSSDAIIGQMTALWLAETLKGDGKLLLLPGEASAEPAKRRLAEALNIFSRFPDLEILDVGWTNWSDVEARRISTEWIGRSHIDGVWCDSGQHGIGSLTAFHAAGFPDGSIPPHTGGDLNGAYKMAVRHKVPLGAVDYPPAMGLVAVETLHAAMTGQWVPKRIDVPSDVILTKGHATASVKPTLWAEDHLRWDLPDDLILHAGIGESYTPGSFRINYPGNSYNRSAAQLARVVQA
jgi:ABC-type sugar transport system substrate-binding protein